MRRAFSLRLVPALAALWFAQTSPHAGETPLAGLELRMGMAVHDPGGPESGSGDLAADFLLDVPGVDRKAGPGKFLPRAQIGFIANFSGRTSLVHTGLNWQIDIAGPVFAELGFGLARHNGATGNASPAGRSALGCGLLFRESVGLGYRLTEQWNIIGSIEHYSNGGRCARNRGLTHLGLRAGYRF